MSASTIILDAFVASAALAIAYFLWHKHKALRLPYPPSPRSYPLIGHLLSVPTQDEAIGFFELGKKLKTDIYHVRLFGTFIIVLNSSEHITNLLEKRSSIYSDRVRIPMVSEPSLMNWGDSTSMLGYGERWRTSRRLIHPWLHKQSAARFHDSQQLQARLLLQRLLKRSPSLEASEDLTIEFYRTVAATIMHSIYGYSVQSSDDSFILRHKEAADNANKAALPSNFLVNLFPILLYVPEWFPGAGWKTIGREWGKQAEYAINSTFEWTKSRIARGEDESSIISSMLAHGEQLGLDKNEIDEYTKQAAAILVAGATDTTKGTLLIFMLAMLLFPEAQKKAQEEIDKVVGSNRLPELADKPRLDYINRLIHELLRWRPTIPTGLPHACSQDDTYLGYQIPKGAIVIGNIWAITRDESVYEDPEKFEPDRYLNPNVPLPPTFGFGRRHCPGMHYAEASLFIVIVSIISTFDIRLAKDANGNNIVPVAESTNDLIYHPKPFKFRLIPRSKAHESLIQTST